MLRIENCQQPAAADLLQQISDLNTGKITTPSNL